MVSYACSTGGQGLDGLVEGARGLDRVFSGCECHQPHAAGDRGERPESSAEQGAETTSTVRAQTMGQTLTLHPHTPCDQTFYSIYEKRGK